MKGAILGANGDLGTAVRKHLNSIGVATFSLFRRGAYLQSLLRPELDSPISFRSQHDLGLLLNEILLDTDFVINCIGSARTKNTDRASLRRLFLANFLVPLNINSVFSNKKVRVIHVSTGGLDADNSRGIISNAAIDLVDFVNATKITSYDAPLSILESSHDSYLSTKLALEILCEKHNNITALRVSNFFGPGCKRLGLIPRMVMARLRGEIYTTPLESRNWSYIDTLACTICDAAINQGNISRPVSWAYGEFDISTKVIADCIKISLPTCYGDFELTEPFVDNTHIHVKYDANALLVAKSNLILQEAIDRTCYYLRSTCDYSESDITLNRKQLDSITQKEFIGGSVASKKTNINGDFVKSCQISGYEGAGRSKIASEINFYIMLGKSGNERLRTLYPKLLGYNILPNESIITLQSIEGISLADEISISELQSYSKVGNFTEALYQSSYLRDLTTVDAVTGMRSLKSLYINRPLARLKNFIYIINNYCTDARLLELVNKIQDGKNIVINNTEYENPISCLQRLLHSETFAQHCAVRSAGYCGHGDYTALNILVSSGHCDNSKMFLIDPRGHIGKWDPLYDLSKMKFSLSGFSSSLKNMLYFTNDGRSYNIHQHSDNIGFRDAHFWFCQWLKTCGVFDRIRTIEPDFLLRILLGEASHYLSDVTYRYAQGANATVAMSVLLLGIERLGYFVDAAEESGIIGVAK